MAVPLKLLLEVWHASHLAEVGMCAADFPMAVLPLWQVSQPFFVLLWLNFVPKNELVFVWQVSQLAVVGICHEDFPLAFDPLWQLTQSPVIPAWSNLTAPINDLVDP
jgi:hypothetical protein